MPTLVLGIGPFVVDRNLDDITTTERSDRRNRRVSSKEILELSDEDEMMSYDILNSNPDTTTSLNECKKFCNISPRKYNLIEASNHIDHDSSAHVGPYYTTLQVHPVRSDEHEEMKEDSTATFFPQMVENRNGT